MCTSAECLKLIEEALPEIKKNYGVTSLCVFGSMSRGENNENSDVDICVEMPPKFMLVSALKEFLETLLGKSVDLIRRHAGMDKFFLQEIERDGIYILR